MGLRGTSAGSTALQVPPAIISCLPAVTIEREGETLPLLLAGCIAPYFATRAFSRRHFLPSTFVDGGDTTYLTRVVAVPSYDADGRAGFVPAVHAGLRILGEGVPLFWTAVWTAVPFTLPPSSIRNDARR